MSKTIFEKLSKFSFGIGLVVKNLMRIPGFAEVLALPAAVLWLIGYSTWYIGTLYFEENRTRRRDKWYGFVEFRQQHLMAALVGTIATTLCIFFPLMIAPTAWLYAISNLLWTLGVIHEKNTPQPENDEFSADKQAFFAKFSLTVTLASIVVAISVTATIIFPLAAPILIPVAGIIGSLLTLLSAGFFIKFSAGSFETDKQKIERKRQVAEEASYIELTEVPHIDLSNRAPCFNNLFPTEQYSDSPPHTPSLPSNLSPS